MELIIRLIMAAISFLVVLLCSSNMIKFSDACNPREREALLNFKHNLDSYSNALSSWVVGTDCCEWNGVFCSKNITERDVVKLQLSHFSLIGELNSSLLELKHLYHLDLSYNNFKQMPAFLGSLQNLMYLDLNFNGFIGKVPPELGNLSSLYHLDLSENELEGEIPITLGILCNLKRLDLSSNKLQGEISSLFTNSSRCSTRKLRLVYLERNQLSGRLPDELGTFQNLEELSLADNSFSGSIPTSLGRLSLLSVLDLDHNKLNGSLPESFGNLSSLEELQISGNMLEGDVTEAHLANLKKLEILDISSMVLNLSPNWVPPFQLRYLTLRNCSIQNGFPKWLQTQKDLVEVDMSNAGISGSVPSWFWNMTSQFFNLDISYNQLEGDLSNVLLGSSSWYGGRIYLNSNRFTGNLPVITSDFMEIDLSRNSFSGPISVLLCSPPVEYQSSLRLLDLSENLLSGELPDCWFYWTNLVLISFESNNIIGKVPSSMGFLSQLRMLHLQKNSLDGELPSSLQNCTELRVMDLGENRLTGAIPTWIGESLKDELRVLRLHSNKFHGEIPQEICYLIRLQILDLGHNNLFGSIPKCFSNFSRMALNRYPNSYTFTNGTILNPKNTVDLVVKGKEMAYVESLLTLVAGIDLSSNNLYGEIPEELTYLFGLQTLNLANNSFAGGIPKGIGHLYSLESLDLSNNRLWGSIPQSLANLTFLSYLNLSYNNLSGEIPLGTQLQSFPQSSYTGNHDLCGLPLDKCDEDGQRQKAPNGDGEGSMEEDEYWIEMKWFYMGLPFGFVVGFWCLWSVLLVKKSWRYAYFRFLDDITYKLSNCLKQKKK